MMKKIALALIVLMSLGVFSQADANQKPKPKILIKIATLAPKGSTNMKILETMKKEVVEKTGNEVGFKIYYGGVQGDAKDVLRKVRFGQLHGATLSGYGLRQIVPEVSLMGLPYVFRNYEEVDYVRSRLRGPIDKKFEKKGYIVLGWYDIGFVYTFSKVPITSVEIARKQKFWTPENDAMSSTAYRVLGISPVSLSITDVMTSLSTRLIDAASAPPLAAVAFRWYTRFKYMSEYPSTDVVGAIIITKKEWDRISPENQTVLKNTTEKYCLMLHDAMRSSNKKCIELLQKSGIKIVHFNEGDYKKFIEESADRIMTALTGKLFSKELLKKTMAILMDYRNTHPSHSIQKISISKGENSGDKDNRS